MDVRLETRKQKRLAMFWAVFGGALVVAGIVRQREVSAASERVEATVVSNVEQHWSGSSVHYCPVLRWTLNGQHHQDRSTACYEEAFAVGSVVPLRVNPDDPTSFMIDSFAGRNTIMLVCLLVGLLMLAGAGSYYRSARARERWAALDEA